ncbi:SOS response-associated peptidase [Methylobacterium soli]|uniref:Abasic site processing protein n=1 Tax=Methylobacterium soli TaxID=553447 RepID=A0A6L3T2K0_9HYPH|nr:SOS response-associated peptidase [Methylobacterium soli]KAB1080137.1 SOS response-associated peptidase [Methylobacterium soli]GJE41190.1 SOS response-associated protein YedK [Methylobacterium soli]
MCGRFFIAQAPEIFRAFFDYPEQPNFPARYNVAPTQPVAVVLSEVGALHFRLMRWGFWPSWLKDPKGFPLVINARVETVQEKPTFRGALRHRRCIFLADGFYEWRREGTGRAAVKTPFKISRADGAPMALAGLWENWIGADGSEIDTAAIVTTGANGTMAAVHDRMPAILAPETIAPWLDTRAVDAAEAAALCRPCPDAWLRLDPVSARVNDARNDGADLIVPVGRPQPAPPVPDIPRADRPLSSDEDAQGSLF